ncbi:MAG TPA: hypothetical protein VM901_10125 [Bdellovibrionota bacterium]|jgi:hypothetical protein|nr:hypothetical protein [Bdellovibrionota bacterium]
MKKGLVVEIFGCDVDAAWTAGRLAERGEVVTWYFNTPRWGTRPQKLHARHYRALVQWLSEKGRRVDFLLTSPEIEGWKVGEGTYSYDFPFLGSELSRWVDTQKLFLELKQVAKELGVRIVECERFPAPDWTDTKLRVLTCDADPLVDWPKALFNQHRKLERIDLCETSYPSDPLGPNTGRIYHFGSTLGLLEPHSATQSSLSLFDENSEAIARCLRALQNPLSSAPSYLRALCMQNMGAKRRFSTLWHGRSRIDAPGIIMMGSAMGNLHPAAGLDLEYRLKQSLDFVEYFEARRESLAESMHAFAETWNRQTEKRFLKAYKSSRMWVRGLRRHQSVRQTVAAATLLPQFLREALKSPL